MMTIPQYAKFAGVSFQAVYYRIKQGMVKAQEGVDKTGRPCLIIDEAQYPPQTHKRGRWREKGQKRGPVPAAAQPAPQSPEKA